MERNELTKRVVVLASGETERRALPSLVAYLQYQNISVDQVLIPPRNGALNPQMAEMLIKAGWYRNLVNPPHKFVILVDTDGKPPNAVLEPFKEISDKLGRDIKAHITFAYAQWHLEAWFFADSCNLRNLLGGALGHVDTSQPDKIENPKLHLKNLLGTRVYTAQVSDEIARKLDPLTIAQRSPSFNGLINAIIDGGNTSLHN